MIESEPSRGGRTAHAHIAAFATSGPGRPGPQPKRVLSSSLLSVLSLPVFLYGQCSFCMAVACHSLLACCLSICSYNKLPTEMLPLVQQGVAVGGIALSTLYLTFNTIFPTIASGPPL